ncbi:MAG: peptidoglycan-binding domain-containing protein [Pseudomonadota bacterium]
MKLTLIVVATLLGGCATTETNTSTAGGSADGALNPLEGELQASQAKNDDLRSELDAKSAQVTMLEAQVAQLRDGGGSPGMTPAADDELFPPNARPGECYARILISEKYKDYDERVLVKQASHRYEVVPAQFETVQERMLAKAASSRLEVVPATYETVSERVLVKAESTRIERIPATYKTETQRVLDKPAHTVWKKGPATRFGAGVVKQSVSGTGEVMCLVEVPASYKTVSKRVIDTPATTREVTIPAEYKSVSRRVVKTPATTRKVEIPAEYQTVSIRKLVRPAAERRVEIPAEYRKISRSEKISEAEMAWQQVLCQVNATPSSVRSLQNALDRAGFDPGGNDGILGANTLQAVARYAQSRDIPYGENYVPLEVLKALKLEI